MVARPERC
uniref:Uncharacterized protein n=1 Tax=Rhizophora mucronata TaxID=61149 RepID=A0A2P2NTW0_RHIMU